MGKNKMENKGIIYGTIAATVLGLGAIAYTIYTDIQRDNKQSMAIVEQARSESQRTRSRLEELEKNLKAERQKDQSNLETEVINVIEAIKKNNK